MSKNKDENVTTKREFEGTQNPWIKRLGLVVLLFFMGFFHAIPNGEEIFVPLVKVMIAFAVIAYVIKLLRGFLKSFWY